MTKPLVLASRKDFSKNLNIIKPGQARYFEKNEKKRNDRGKVGTQDYRPIRIIKMD